MSNILILNGAPRKNGSTASLVKAFTEGATVFDNQVRKAYIQGIAHNVNREIQFAGE